MKKIALLFVLVLALLIGCLAIPVTAAGERTGELYSCNLSFRDSVCLKYALDSQNPNAKLLVWTSPQAEYTKGTEDYELTSTSDDIIGGERFMIFDFTKLSAKEMTVDVYTRPYINGEYGKVVKYSILQYCYNKLGYTGTKSTDGKLITLINATLAQGAAAQDYFNYSLARLATERYYQVKLTAGNITDAEGKNHLANGLYKEGDCVMLTAPAVNENSVPFSHWEKNGVEVAETATCEITVGTENAVYTPVYSTDPTTVTKSYYVTKMDREVYFAPNSATDPNNRRDGTSLSTLIHLGGNRGTIVTNRIADTADAVVLTALDGSRTITLSGPEFTKLIRQSLGLFATPDVANGEAEINVYQYCDIGSVVHVSVKKSTGKVVSAVVSENSQIVDTYLQATSGLEGGSRQYGQGARNFSYTEQMAYPQADQAKFLGWTIRELKGTYENVKPALPLSYNTDLATSWTNIERNGDGIVTSATLNFKGVAYKYSDVASERDIEICMAGSDSVLTANEAVTMLINAAQGECFVVFNDIDGDGRYDNAVIKESDPFLFVDTPNARGNDMNTNYTYYSSVSNGVKLGESTMSGFALGTVIYNQEVHHSLGSGSDTVYHDYSTYGYSLTAKNTGKLQLILRASNKHFFIDGAVNYNAANYVPEHYAVVDLATFSVGILDSVDTANVDGFYKAHVVNADGTEKDIFIPEVPFATATFDVTVGGATATYTFDSSMWCELLSAINGDISWLTGRCVQYVVNERNEVIAILGTDKQTSTTGFVIGAEKTGNNTYNVKIAQSGEGLVSSDNYYLTATNQRPGYEGQWVITNPVRALFDWADRDQYLMDIPYKVDWGTLNVFRYQTNYYSAYGFNGARHLITTQKYFQPTTDFVPNFNGGIHGALNGNPACNPWTVNDMGIVVDHNGKEVIFQKKTMSRLGVAGIYETEVRASASSLFDYANYAVYEAIFKQDSLMNPAAVDDAKANVNSIVSGSDLIYVTVYEDGASNYLMAGDSTNGVSKMIQTVRTNTVSTQNTDAYYPQNDNVLAVVTGQQYVESKASLSWMNDESRFTIVPQTMINDTKTVGEDGESFTAQYMTTVGYRPYYLRIWNAEAKEFTYEYRFEEVRSLCVTGYGSTVTGEVAYDYDNATVLDYYTGMDDQTLFTYYKKGDGTYRIGKYDSLNLKPADSSMEGWHPGLYTMTYSGSTYQIPFNAEIILITPNASGFTSQTLTVEEAASAGVFVTSANFVENFGKVNTIAVIGELVGEVVTPTKRYSEGLAFTLKADGESYSAGIGTCADTDIVIPPTYEGKPVTSIHFRNCNSIASIEIPASVTSLGYAAVENCPYLARVTFAEGSRLTSIGYATFRYCSNLTSINIPDSVTSIGDFAFRNCSSLKSIEIPESVTRIGDWAFCDCSSFTSINIPEGVTSIGHLAFRNCSSLTSINIPEGVTSIGDSAFHNCSSLKSITLPDSVTSIGNSAFYGCTKLIQTVGDVDYVGNWAIDCNPMAKAVSLKKDTVGIALGIFDGCTYLTSIELPETIKNISSYKAITDAASMSMSTTHITFIQNAMTGEGEGVFYGCSSLKTILVSESNPYFRSVDGVLFSKDMTELVCYPAKKEGTTYSIPNGVTKICDSAFAHCDSLESITLPETVTRIGFGAFDGCSSLVSLYIPEGVTSIGSMPFSDTNALTSITVSENNPYYCSVDGVLFNKDMTELICHPANKEGATYTIPSSVASLSYGAFYNCGSLMSINIPESVTSIGYYAFFDCSRLTSITIPDSLTRIDSHTFSGCSSLTSIVIPNSVTIIDDSAFFGCSSLTSIEIQSIMAGIGASAFRDCSSLMSIEIPARVPSISVYAFSGCSSLTSIVIPNSVFIIDNAAFSGCSSLMSITYNGTKEQWNAIAKNGDWNNNTGNYTIHCTDGDITK